MDGIRIGMVLWDDRVDLMIRWIDWDGMDGCLDSHLDEVWVVWSVFTFYLCVGFLLGFVSLFVWID